MLYQIYEAQRSLIEPFADIADATAKIYGNPHSMIGQLPLAQRVSAAYALFHRLGKDYEKPEFGIRNIEVDGVHIAIDERVELEKPFCQLRRFKRFSDDPATLTRLKEQPPVLIVAPLSGHYATLLRDTVRTMLEGHKVYITDWKNARMVPLSEGEFHLDDYVNYVQEFIRHLQGIYGNCHIVSVCQPTVPVLAAVSLMASRGEKTPVTMTMMGGPIDARRSPTAVNALAVQRSFEWFENNVIYRVPPNYPGAGRRVYPGFLQHAGFIAMNPDRHATSHYDYFQDLIKGDQSSADTHRQFYDEYNAVLDMDADYYLETIQTVFQEFKLVNGTWDVRSPNGKIERVRPQDITRTALLTIEGELDDISGSGQTRAAHDLCSGIARRDDDHMEVEGAGHYGIFSGRRWRTMVYPRVKDYIIEHASAEIHEEDVRRTQAALKNAERASKRAEQAMRQEVTDQIAQLRLDELIVPDAGVPNVEQPVTSLAVPPATVEPTAPAAAVTAAAATPDASAAAPTAQAGAQTAVEPAQTAAEAPTVKTPARRAAAQPAAAKRPAARRPRNG